MRRLISIIVPVYNEEPNIPPLFARLDGLVAQLRASNPDLDFEVVVTDNHSTDRTFDVLREIASAGASRPYPIRVFRFARNIGFQKSILVGYAKARGDAVVQIDADLQDPPELIETFIAKWREGYRIVYGVRRSRQEGILVSGLRRLFYRLIDRISRDRLPHDAGDFRLVDRAAVDIVVALHDHDPYLRGLFASLGMKQAGIPYDRAARTAGVSKFGLGDLFRLSWDGITNHSVMPLQLSTYLALVVAIAGVALAAFYFVSWLLFDADLPLGFLTSVLVQLGSLATLAFLIGIQGQYISRIFAQLKEKPLAIVEERLASTPGQAGESDALEVLWVGRGTGTVGGRSQPCDQQDDAGRPNGGGST